MEITPTTYINNIQKDGYLRVKKIINTPGLKTIVMIDRFGGEWERNFKTDGVQTD